MPFVRAGAFTAPAVWFYGATLHDGFVRASRNNVGRQSEQKTNAVDGGLENALSDLRSGAALGRPDKAKRHPALPLYIGVVCCRSLAGWLLVNFLLRYRAVGNRLSVTGYRHYH